ncbi:MAG: MFS transporter [Candidatus Dormibacteraceae bacterium]
MGFLRHLALASFWFGLNYHWIPILAILVPNQVRGMLGVANQGFGIGLITALGAIPATVVPPLVGYYSDRLNTRWGRRRPIMAIGILFNVVGLVIMFAAPNYPVLVIGYLFIQVSNNAAGAAFNAVVPDTVPEPEFGKASGVLGAMVQIGAVAGLASLLLLSKAGNVNVTYLAIAVVISLSLIPTLMVTKGEGMSRIQAEPSRPLGERVREFLAPLTHGDFAWVIGTRTLITAGIYSVLPFLLPFFSDVVKVGKADQFTALWELLLLVAATPFGLAGGWLSDRLGRKIFVYASGAAQSLVIIAFIALFPTSQFLVLLLGVLFGIGYGLYYAVDWALAIDTLPDKAHSAKDMGLFHVAFTLPQVLLPAIMGPILDIANHRSANSGYRIIFSAAIVFYLLGTVLVSRIKSVR